MFKIQNVWDFEFPSPTLVLPLPQGGGGLQEGVGFGTLGFGILFRI